MMKYGAPVGTNKKSNIAEKHIDIDVSNKRLTTETANKKTSK